MDGLEWKTLLKWMIWGYPYFWKHPYLPGQFFVALSFFGFFNKKNGPKRKTLQGFRTEASFSCSCAPSCRAKANCFSKGEGPASRVMKKRPNSRFAGETLRRFGGRLDHGHVCWDLFLKNPWRFGLVWAEMIENWYPSWWSKLAMGFPWDFHSSGFCWDPLLLDSCHLIPYGFLYTHYKDSQ